MISEQKWTTVIKPKTGWMDIHLKEVWQYRDLIYLFVKRDFVTQYKQTVLGPLWYLIQPLLTTLMFSIVFGTIAKIPTDGVPQFIFYMSGNIAWLYFSQCITKTSNTFVTNVNIFGKVYFPRLTTPIATVLTGLINFGIQFLLFIGFLVYFLLTDTTVHPNVYIALTPVLIVQMALLGMGFGIIISSLTTKYRDLTVLVSFGVQLWMYATPVVYPISTLSEKAASLILLNPMAPVVAIFRYAFLGTGSIPWMYWGISWITTIVVLLLGIVLFSRVEKTFMDTV